MQCPKCREKMEWKYNAEATTLVYKVVVEVTFLLSCPACGWDAEVSATNSISQEEVNAIYLTESKNGD